MSSQLHQASTSTPLTMPPLMTTLSPSTTPIFLGLPFSDLSQPDRINCFNLSPSQGPGSYSLYNHLGLLPTIHLPRPRKRGREEELDLINACNNSKIAAGLPPSSPTATGLSENHRQCSSNSSKTDIYQRMLREQQELDLLVLMQMEKLRVELEQKRRHYWSNMLQAVEERLQRITNGKDEEIAKMSRKNTALEEKVRVLVMEGQIWKMLAQTNEATATSLRRDLELVQAREGEGESGQGADTLSGCHGDYKKTSTNHDHNDNDINDSSNYNNIINHCHRCRKNEISVLVLPCRHLCMCSECDKVIESCPLCMSPKRTSIQVLMS